MLMTDWNRGMDWIKGDGMFYESNEILVKSVIGAVSYVLSYMVYPLKIVSLIHMAS